MQFHRYELLSGGPVGTPRRFTPSTYVEDLCNLDNAPSIPHVRDVGCLVPQW